jgi:hypothetical protein
MKIDKNESVKDILKAMKEITKDVQDLKSNNRIVISCEVYKKYKKIINRIFEIKE